MSTPEAPSPTPPRDPRPGTVFQLARDLVDLPEALTLRNLEWGVLFAVTGEHTVAQIGEHFGLDADESATIFKRLISEGLIVEREVSYGEYLRATATLRDDEPRTLARFLRAGVTFGPLARVAGVGEAARPRPAAPSRGTVPSAAASSAAAPSAPAPPATSPASAPSSPAASTVPSGEAEIHQTRAVPTFSRDELSRFEPLAQPPAVPSPAGPALRGTPPLPLPAPAPGEPRAAAGRPLSLKRVMQFILDRAPDLNAGQLDIYRVFIRVNTKLLRRNGINTLRFEEDRLITDDELQRAITASVEKTLGLPCPQEVFLAA
ncbi:MAG: hypothetical protein AAFX50_13985 [Acidobacteriota bacterium]